MKFKFRADPEDMFVFLIFSVFLLYVVAIGVVNIHTFATEGHLSGLNPLPAFAPQYLFSTIFLFLLFEIALFANVSSIFFEREDGFGISIFHASKGYSRWARSKEIQEELVRVPLTAKNSKAAGIPIILNKEEMWVDNGEYHSLVIGATGSGKTQGIIHPMVHSLCKARESMIITDPKGEIYEGNAEMLRKRGYQILILNFRDPQNGNAWNPMSMPYKLYKAGNHDKAIELLDDLALNILYDETNKNADPFWEKTSADYFSGVALGLFEDAKEDEININSISLATTVGEEKFGGSTYIKEYFNMKDPASAASINASSTIMAPSETKGSILSVFKQKVKLFASRDNLSEMLSYSDIDLETIGERPTAVFIVVQDEKKTYHSLVTILIKQIYETLIDTAQKHGGKLPVRTNFLLDEFANMPPLKDVTTMITAARSRKIRFTMIIQNFAQLDSVYGKEDAETIRGNCGNIIYLITTELKALEEISKMCGEVKSKQEDKTASTPLVTVSDLQRMKQYEVIILRMRKQPFKTKITPNYKLDWGVKYPLAKYPTRAKRTLHTFDIKEFVKDQKKKKLLEMMNAADEEGGRASSGREFGTPISPSFGPSSELPGFGNRGSNSGGIPDFLIRNGIPKNDDMPIGTPSFGSHEGSSPYPGFIPSPTQSNHEPESANVDDLGFDVDELVRKIDAKIAELEAEEQEQKKQEETEAKEAKVEEEESSTDSEEAEIVEGVEPIKEEVSSVPVTVEKGVEEEAEKEPKYEYREKQEESTEVSKKVAEVGKEVVKIEEKTLPSTASVALAQTLNAQKKHSYDEEEEEDDFFDDFFDE